MSDSVYDKIYTLDTNFMVDGMALYPVDIAPDIWEHILQMINEGRIIICDPVYQEILAQDDDVSKWLKTNVNGALIEPTEEDLQFVQDEIMAHYEEKFSKWFGLEDPNGLDADPFLVATAATRKITLVTGENKLIMQENTPLRKIPNVCEGLEVECICNDRKNTKQFPMIDFLRDSGFRQ